MKNTRKSERGQAIVLIAFAIIGLIGMAGLTIDGGFAYSDRRNAQNAADNAALAAGRAFIREENYTNAGLALAVANGYNNNGTTNTVNIYKPPQNGTYAGNNEYIQVVIVSHYQTGFARVLGVNQMTNVVDAVARVIPSKKVNLFDGSAVVGLSPHDCKAVKYQGNANTTITGTGIYVNSDCATSAFFNNSAAAQLTAPSMCSVGGITYEPGAINIPGDKLETGCEAYTYPSDEYVMPLPNCTGNATVSGNSMSPGLYSSNQAFPPAGVTVLQPGIYCVDANFTLNGGDSLFGTNVIIYMIDGDVTWNGGATVNLDAPDDGPFAGLLLYSPYENSSTIKINGDSTSTFQGTFLAPSSAVEVNGSGSNTGIDGQIIGYTVDLTGTSATTINFDSSKNYEAITPPFLELTK